MSTTNADSQPRIGVSFFREGSLPDVAVGHRPRWAARCKLPAAPWLSVLAPWRDSWTKRAPILMMGIGVFPFLFHRHGAQWAAPCSSEQD